MTEPRARRHSGRVIRQGFPIVRVLASALVAAAIAAAMVGCGGSSTGGDSGYARYHEPSQGWTANVPAGWTSVVLGPQFVRGEPLADPTRLLLRTYRHRRPATALRELAAAEGIIATAREDERAGERLRWRRYRGREAGQPRLAVNIAVAGDGADTHVVALVARRAELDRLVRTALLPALDSFVPGPPDPSRSVLATAPPDPSYWPTRAWHTAAPASEGMDGTRLDAMLAEIRAARLPIDSVTIIRHGIHRAGCGVRTLRLRPARRAVRLGAPSRAAVGDEVGDLDGARHRPEWASRGRRQRDDTGAAPRRRRPLRPRACRRAQAGHDARGPADHAVRARMERVRLRL